MEFKWCGLSDVTEKGEWGLLDVVYLGLGPMALEYLGYKVSVYHAIYKLQMKWIG
jgi:hypothetical protein